MAAQVPLQSLPCHINKGQLSNHNSLVRFSSSPSYWLENISTREGMKGGHGAIAVLENVAGAGLDDGASFGNDESELRPLSLQP